MPKPTCSKLNIHTEAAGTQESGQSLTLINLHSTNKPGEEA